MVQTASQVLQYFHPCPILNAVDVLKVKYRPILDATKSFAKDPACKDEGLLLDIERFSQGPGGIHTDSVL
ncbi:UNVERIFIED_CONTAM: hypothetical protein FKN15_034735 [Acipenser sinensis]